MKRWKAPQIQRLRSACELYFPCCSGVDIDAGALLAHACGPARSRVKLIWCVTSLVGPVLCCAAVTLAMALGKRRLRLTLGTDRCTAKLDATVGQRSAQLRHGCFYGSADRCMGRNKHQLHLVFIQVHSDLERTESGRIELQFGDLMTGFAQVEHLLSERLVPILATHCRAQRGMLNRRAAGLRSDDAAWVGCCRGGWIEQCIGGRAESVGDRPSGFGRVPGKSAVAGFKRHRLRRQCADGWHLY